MVHMPDAPPRRRPSTGSQKPREAPTEEKTAPRVETPGKPVSVLQKRLEKFFGGMALPFLAAGDVHCAGLLAKRGPIVAEAWANLAAESPAVKAALESLLKGGAWAGAIGSTIGLVVPIAAHHGAPIPDPITAIILGEVPNRHADATEPEEEYVNVSPNGNAAATATNPGRNSADATNPANYPGVHNTPIESD